MCTFLTSDPWQQQGILPQTTDTDSVFDSLKDQFSVKLKVVVPENPSRPTCLAIEFDLFILFYVFILNSNKNTTLKTNKE